MARTKPIGITLFALFCCRCAVWCMFLRFRSRIVSLDGRCKHPRRKRRTEFESTRNTFVSRRYIAVSFQDFTLSKVFLNFRDHAQSVCVGVVSTNLATTRRTVCNPSCRPQKRPGKIDCVLSKTYVGVTTSPLLTDQNRTGVLNEPFDVPALGKASVMVKSGPSDKLLEWQWHAIASVAPGSRRPRPLQQEDENAGGDSDAEETLNLPVREETLSQTNYFWRHSELPKTNLKTGNTISGAFQAISFSGITLYTVVPLKYLYVIRQTKKNWEHLKESINVDR